MNADPRPLAIAIDALSDVRAGAEDAPLIAARAIERMEPDCEGTGAPVISFVADVDDSELRGPVFGWDTSKSVTTVRLDIRADVDGEGAADLVAAILAGTRGAMAQRRREAQDGVN